DRRGDRARGIGMRANDGEDAVFRATSMAELPALIAFIERACAKAGASEDVVCDVRLAAEEVFSNTLMHGYGDRPGLVTVRIDATPERIIVTMADDAPAFDPGSIAAPDIAAPLQERGIGGLGWHLVRQVMDEVRREPGASGGNVFTLVR